MKLLKTAQVVSGSKRYFILGILAIVLVLAMGCSGYGTSVGDPAAPAADNSITISNFSFSPASLTVAVGTKVTWTNKDSVPHTVTSDSGVFDSGTMAPNASFSYTFSTAGTFPYHCSVHPNMKGSVTVR